MMELLTAARVRSANFFKLLAACYICKIAGCQLSHTDQCYDLRTLLESDTAIMAAITAYATGKDVSKANARLKELSLLPVEVRNRAVSFFIFFTDVISYVEWLRRSSAVFAPSKCSL
jgi:hypothetical protein